jgi:ribosomal protein S18 acetylase RimI-like enzyme
LEGWVRIRDGGPRDAPEIAALLGELGYPIDSSMAAARLLRRTERVLLAEERGSALGLVAVGVSTTLTHARPVGRLTALVVREGARGRGVGRALVLEALRLAAAAGCEGLELTSGLGPERAAAHRFYESLGFERTSYRFWLSLSRPA